jgi:rod shape-determining protein MreC
MNVILRFIRVNAFYFVFGLLQLLCLYQVVRFNSYQQTFYFNTSRAITGNFLSARQSVIDYFYLRDHNEQLAAENLALRQQLAGNRFSKDTALYQERGDSTAPFRYKYVKARVVQSSVNKLNNFITIDKGTKAGVRRGMAVLSPTGIAGIVHDVSDEFSLVLSVLNTKFRVSPMIPDIGFREGNVSWDGKDENFVQLNGINKFEKIKKGSKVLTSSYSPHFPEGVTIGEIESFTIPGNSSFYDVQVRLTTPFNKLHTTYVVFDIYRAQIDSLNQSIQAK